MKLPDVSLSLSLMNRALYDSGGRANFQVMVSPEEDPLGHSLSSSVVLPHTAADTFTQSGFQPSRYRAG